MDNKLPIITFNLGKVGNIARVVRGEKLERSSKLNHKRRVKCLHPSPIAPKKAWKKLCSRCSVNLKKVRTGRAQISMLDSIKVNYYGTPTPLNQVAALSTPDARSFLISPWEIRF